MAFCHLGRHLILLYSNLLKNRILNLPKNPTSTLKNLFQTSKNPISDLKKT